MARKIPILLLKSRSTPTDAYEDLFSKPADGFGFEPAFVPVLEHTFDAHGMERLRHLLQARSFGTEPGCQYGGLIFTSQRAVEAFAKLVADGPGETAPWLDILPDTHLAACIYGRGAAAKWATG